MKCQHGSPFQRSANLISLIGGHRDNGSLRAEPGRKYSMPASSLKRKKKKRQLKQKIVTEREHEEATADLDRRWG